MPFAPPTTLIGRAGAFYTGYICSLAGLIFREGSDPDVGIDGIIELVDGDGRATGKLAGVQVKSGSSFVNEEAEVFTIRAERKHFEYWENYCLPVIGVVFSPGLRRAVWFDISGHASRIVAEDGPYQLTQPLTSERELTVETASGALTRLIQRAHGLPVSADDVERNSAVEEEAEEELSKEMAWKRLITILLSSDSDPDVRADAGYRVSWYFPTVPEEQQRFFKERIAHVTQTHFSGHGQRFRTAV